ncbi:MAG: diacylglycerol kinase family lipid kinase [Saprospiraceae bacterium]|nr:diacylglycerol kinase family lipid kinase [Saprospiraceae bacterium]
MYSKQKIVFIVNPFSGAKSKNALPTLIDQYLDKSKFDYELQFTESAGHASVLAQQAVESHTDIVVACGGDGTVNEVAKSIVNQKTALGIIPYGSGNGFAMHIGLGRNIKKAIKILNTAESKCIDSCTVNDRFFLNLAGVGFDALIAFKAHEGEKRGFKMYFNLVRKEIFNFKAPEFTVKLNNKSIEGPFTTIAVANAAMYGYNFTVAPLAEMTDGLLDVVFIKKASIFRILLSTWRMLNNSLHKSRLVSIEKCKTVTIESKYPYYFHIDGESFEFSKPLNFELLPKSINVLFPASKLSRF